MDTDAVVGGPWLDDRSSAAASWALLLGLGLLMMGNGLNGLVLGVRSEAEGFGLTVTGLVMACYYVGFLAGSVYTVRLIETVGHIRVFAAFASLASSAVLVHSVSVTPPSWAAMRFVFGLCMAGLYVVTESWLNDLATNETRGRLLGLYMVFSMGGLAAGQLLLSLGDANGFGLFILASVLVSISLIPVTLSASSTPPLREPARLSFRELLRIVPTGVVGSFWVGASHGTLVAMGAVYAAAVGVPKDRIAVLLSAPLVGALVAQWPIGALADRFPRRGVIFVTAVAASAAALALFAVDDGSTGAVALMFVLGGASFSLYSLVIAYTNDWLSQEQFVAASALQIRINGVGAIIGPLVAAGIMGVWGPRWIFVVLVGTHAVIAAYVGYRIFTADPLPMGKQRRFVAFPARAGALAGALVPRNRKR